VRPNLDLPEQPLVRAAEDADARCRAVAREQEIVLRVDEDASDTRQLRGECSQVSARRTVEHLDPIGARVRDIHPPPAREDVGVIEPRLGALRDRDECGADEAHAVAPPATSFLHQA
jgi:hypothetical protein